MKKNYRYRPPVFYIFLGLGAFYASFIFLRTVRLTQFGEHGFQVLVGFFGLTCLVLGIISVKKLFENLSLSNLEVSDDFIEIPVSWGKTVRVLFSDIECVESTFDNLIKILGKHGSYTIDGNRMRRSDFRELKQFLIESKFGPRPPSR